MDAGGTIAILAIHYLVAMPEGVEHFTEHDELDLSTDKQYRAAFAYAGLDSGHDAAGLLGRGLYIGTPALA